MTTEKLWRWFIMTVVVTVNMLTCQGNRDSPVDIIFTDWQAENIVKLNVEGSNVTQTTLFSSITPYSIGYDDVEKRLYWMEEIPMRIRSSDVDGRNVRLVTDLPQGLPYGLTVSSMSRKLFYTDHTRDVIVSMDITGENVNTILNKTQVSNPVSITVNERKSIIIWSDGKSRYKISSSNYDGSDIKKILDVSGEVFGLALDERNDVLYWSVSWPGTISSVFLNGTNRRVLYNENNKDLYDIVLLENTMYFLSNARVHCMLINGSNVEEIQSTSEVIFPFGLVVLAKKNLENCPFGDEPGTNCNLNNCEARGILCCETCAPPVTEATTDAVTDATTEAVTDATRDSATDATTDAATDATTDAATDATMDAVTGATTDAVTDATRDAVTDATRDSASDATMDAATDATMDAITGPITDAATGATMDAATDATTDAVTGATMDAVTGATTDAVTGPTMDAATDATTDAVTGATMDAVTGATTDATTASSGLQPGTVLSTTVFIIESC